MRANIWDIFAQYVHFLHRLGAVSDETYYIKTFNLYNQNRIYNLKAALRSGRPATFTLLG